MYFKKKKRGRRIIRADYNRSEERKVLGGYKGGQKAAAEKHSGNI